MPSTLRLMHVHAHPDDESSKGAASTAKYVAEGVDVHVVTCTGGERGSILNPKMDRPDVLANIAEIRRQEMDRAREILGVRQDWLGFVDSGLPGGRPAAAAAGGLLRDAPGRRGGRAAGAADAVVPAARRDDVRRERRLPAPRPRHVPPGRVAAFEAAGDPARYPDAGEPWQPLKLYYHHAFHRERTQALHDEMLRQGLESPYAERLAEWKPDPVHAARVTTRVPCAEYFPVRDQALLAHATQIDPEGPWFACPLRVHQQAWPTEDYELARSLVEVETPESDLFAGVRELVETMGT